MKGSAITASLAVILVTSSVSAFAQAAGQTAQPPRPAAPQPAAPAPASAPQPPLPFPVGAKFAYIDPPRIFQESQDGKAALGRVQALTQKKTSEAQAKQKALQENQQKLQSSGNVMSDAART